MFTCYPGAREAAELVDAQGEAAERGERRMGVHVEPNETWRGIRRGMRVTRTLLKVEAITSRLEAIATRNKKLRATKETRWI